MEGVNRSTKHNLELISFLLFKCIIRLDCYQYKLREYRGVTSTSYVVLVLGDGVDCIWPFQN